MTSEEDFAPIWEESILLEEHEAVQASVDVGGWLSAALDDPNVCDQMKADINRWFSAGFLYLDNVRQLMQADREAVRAPLLAEIERLRGALKLAANRLERNAVDYIAAGDPHSYEQSEWADEARRAALAGDSHDQ